MAEEKGFEPLVPFSTHDFQSCTFGHSVTPPGLGLRPARSGPAWAYVRCSLVTGKAPLLAALRACAQSGARSLGLAPRPQTRSIEIVERFYVRRPRSPSGYEDPDPLRGTKTQIRDPDPFGSESRIPMGFWGAVRLPKLRTPKASGRQRFGTHGTPSKPDASRIARPEPSSEHRPREAFQNAEKEGFEPPVLSYI